MSFLEFKKSVLGKPYKINPLSSLKGKEVLITTTDSFDCVTLVEHFLALNSLGKYNENIKKIRYFNSKVTWKSRKHYFSTWLSDNQKLKYIKRVILANEKIKRNNLNLIKELPIIKNSVKYSLDKTYQVGDIIAFVSSQKNLDYFHVGIISSKTKIIHASKTKNKVLEENLTSFLKRTDCIGYTIYRIKDLRIC